MDSAIARSSASYPILQSSNETYFRWFLHRCQLCMSSAQFMCLCWINPCQTWSLLRLHNFTNELGQILVAAACSAFWLAHSKMVFFHRPEVDIPMSCRCLLNHLCTEPMLQWNQQFTQVITQSSALVQMGGLNSTPSFPYYLTGFSISFAHIRWHVPSWHELLLKI
jgi:hypothetical protein